MLQIVKRRGLLLVIGLLVLAAGGFAWADTRSAGQNVITACVNDAHQMFLSPNGSCPSNETTLSWNQQGPPGPAGQAPQPVLAHAPSSYKRGFSIKGEIDAPGDYFIDGSVDLSLTPTLKDNHFHAFKAYCNLYRQPPNSTATRIAGWTMIFKRTANGYSPASVSGPVDVNGTYQLPQSETPLTIILSCQDGLDAVWTHPAITYEATSNPAVFHPTVGPALPNKPKIGPGPIGKIFATR
jgi:hypothetical protein